MSIMSASFFICNCSIILVAPANIEISNRHLFLYWHYQIDFDSRIIHLKGLDMICCITILHLLKKVKFEKENIFVNYIEFYTYMHFYKTFARYN